jgi:hypothetical protein
MLGSLLTFLTSVRTMVASCCVIPCLLLHGIVPAACVSSHLACHRSWLLPPCVGTGLCVDLVGPHVRLVALASSFGSAWSFSSVFSCCWMRDVYASRRDARGRDRLLQRCSCRASPMSPHGLEPPSASFLRTHAWRAQVRQCHVRSKGWSASDPRWGCAARTDNMTIRTDIKNVGLAGEENLKKPWSCHGDCLVISCRISSGMARWCVSLRQP